MDVMKTYSLELRHAPSKNRLNALENNRLSALRVRLKSDDEAISWARTEVYQFADRNRGFYFQYIEAALMELLPISASGGDDYRRLGRWVINHDGVNWRPTPQKADA
jgi:hypothetical protein